MRVGIDARPARCGARRLPRAPRRPRGTPPTTGRPAPAVSNGSIAPGGLEADPAVGVLLDQVAEGAQQALGVIARAAGGLAQRDRHLAGDAREQQAALDLRARDRHLVARCAVSAPPRMVSGSRRRPCSVKRAPICSSGTVTRRIGRRRSDASPVSVARGTRWPASMPSSSRVVVPELPQSSTSVGAPQPAPAGDARRRCPRCSGEIGTPSWRRTRALERASSEVSAPPTWLGAARERAEEQRAMRDALVARHADDAMRRSSIDPPSEGGALREEVPGARRRPRACDERGELGQARRPSPRAPPAPPRGSAGGCRSTAPGRSRRGGSCRGRRARS